VSYVCREHLEPVDHRGRGCHDCATQRHSHKRPERRLSAADLVDRVGNMLDGIGDRGASQA
jgi:hypothetical protein